MAPEPNILDALREGRRAARQLRLMTDNSVLTPMMLERYLNTIDAAFDRMLGPADAPVVRPFTVIDGGRP